MAGFRVTTDVHHVPDQADGREFFVVFNGWQNWRLTGDEARQLSADLLMALAQDRANHDQPIDAGHPDLWSLSAAEPF